MLKLAVLVSGGGTNLQALIDRIEQGTLPGVRIEVVISNKREVYALERARKHGIAAEALVKGDFAGAAMFNKALLELLDRHRVDLVVLAGCLLILPENVVKIYRNRIINIHPSLIPSFCGDGYYGLRVHEAVLKRGVKITGATVHFVDEEGDTPELLQKRVMEQAEWELLSEAVRLISENKLVIENNIVKQVE